MAQVYLKQSTRPPLPWLSLRHLCSLPRDFLFFIFYFFPLPEKIYRHILFFMAPFNCIKYERRARSFARTCRRSLLLGRCD